jgi:phosphosulfolactate synthase (CoM biosynthesis protein A)
MKNHNKFWIVFSLIIVFAAGVVGGIFFERSVLDKKTEKYTRSRRHVRFPSLETMSQELDLTTEQQEKIREIFKTNEESFKRLRSQIHESLSSMRTQLKDEIKSVLNEEQNRKFETMIEKYLSQRRDEQEKRKKYSKKSKRDKGAVK